MPMCVKGLHFIWIMGCHYTISRAEKIFESLLWKVAGGGDCTKFTTSSAYLLRNFATGRMQAQRKSRPQSTSCSLGLAIAWPGKHVSSCCLDLVAKAFLSIHRATILAKTFAILRSLKQQYLLYILSLPCTKRGVWGKICVKSFYSLTTSA